jgi:lysophospholipase L1-like esterase
MKSILNNRRKFIRQVALGSVLSSIIPDIIAAAPAPKKSSSITLKEGTTILFQGDSITDAGRKKDTKDFNTTGALGSGYAMLAAATLLDQHPNKDLKIYNRGISGNKVYQLAERWDADALDIKPDVLSIMIGVNDYWHTITNGYKGTIKTYKDDYKTLLDRTLQKLPDVKLIIGEPFGVNGVKAVTDSWYPAFNDYRQAAKEIAESFSAVFIPYQTVFDEAQKKAPGIYWTGDGVHPTLAGSQLMAHAWLKTVKG